MLPPTIFPACAFVHSASHLLHQLHDLRPALDDLVRRERGWLPALEGRVEDGPVDELPLVVALARRVGLGRLAVRDGACAQHLVLEAAGQSHDTVLALVLGEECGAGGVAGRGDGEAGD